MSDHERPRQAVPAERIPPHSHDGGRGLGPGLRYRQKRHRYRGRHVVHLHPLPRSGHRAGHPLVSPPQAQFLPQNAEGGPDHRRGYVRGLLDAVSGLGPDHAIEERLFERVLLPDRAVYLVGGLPPSSACENPYRCGHLHRRHRAGVADRGLLHQLRRRRQHRIGVPLRRRDRDHRPGHARQRRPDHHRHPAIHRGHLGPATCPGHATHAHGGAGDHARVHRCHDLRGHALGGLRRRGAEHGAGPPVALRGGPALLA